MPASAIVPFIFSASSAVIGKALSIATQTHVDQPTRDWIRTHGNIAISHIKEKIDAAPPSPATNHDLQRALCMAYCNAGRAIIFQLRQYPEHDLTEADATKRNPFIERFQGYIGTLEREAYKRHENFEGLIDNDLLGDILKEVPEAGFETKNLKEVSNQITLGFKKWLEVKEGQGLLAVFDQLLDRKDTQRCSLFGQDVLARLIEILKNGRYIEATRAFDHHIAGTMRTAITEIGAKSTEMQVQLGNLEDIFDNVALQLAKHDEHFDAVRECQDKILLRITRSSILNLDRKNVIHEESSPFDQMTFRQRRAEFVGREAELDQLQKFIDAETNFSWWQVAGDGGQGKSRLGLHFIDNLGSEWHAGFLNETDLDKLIKGEVEFEAPTLCVIDYAAAPQKAEKVVDAIRALHLRSQVNAPLPLEAKVRVLVLERAGYGLSDETGELNSGKSGLNWLRTACKNNDTKLILRSTVHKANTTLEPLNLEVLDEYSMLSIARSWRHYLIQSGREIEPLTQTQEENLLHVLKRDSDTKHTLSQSAWRPLFAIMYASVADETFDTSSSVVKIEDLLQSAFEQEQTTHWPKGLNPSKGAHNIACLATMLEGVRANDIYKNLNDWFSLTVDEIEEFYGDIEGDAGHEACYLLGYPSSAHNPDDLQFLPRQPDLLGEFMILWSLKSFTDSVKAKQDAEIRIGQLVLHAAVIAHERLGAFLIRLNEDFPHHFPTQSLLNAPWPDRNFSDVDISSPAYFGLTGLLRTMLAGGANPNGLNPESGTFPLLLSAEEGHTGCVKLLLENGVEPNSINPINGTFPLLQAAQSGHTDCVKLLLEYEANPNSFNPENGAFPLLMAAQSNRTECVKLLLEHKADPNTIKSQNGICPLLLAAQNGHSECVKLLLEKGADPNLIHAENGTFPLLRAAQNGHSDCVRLLLEYKTDPNTINSKNGAFPLLMAAGEGHTECVKLLLENGADPNQIHTETGISPLILVTENGHTKCAKLLLENGADPNQIHTETGISPLIYATENGHTECVKLLLKYKADPNYVEFKQGGFSLLIAAQNGHADSIRLLLEKKAEPNQIHNETSNSPLQQAVLQGYTECVRLLLENGADPDLIHKKTGAFPLLIAAVKGYTECAKLLLENGAYPSLVHTETNTFPLLLVAENGYTECVELLLEYKADPNQVHTKTNHSPLMLAAHYGHTDCVELLLQYGAKPLET